MAQKTKRIYRTIKQPARVSKKVTVKEAEKAAKECGKKEKKDVKSSQKKITKIEGLFDDMMDHINYAQGHLFRKDIGAMKQSLEEAELVLEKILEK